MTPSPARWKDLGAAVTLVVGALLIGLLPLPDWAQAAVLLPAVLVAPGYAIGAALFRPDEIPSEYRVVLSVALSLSAIALGGLLVQLALPLNRLVLACLLVLITIGAGLIAFDRRQTAPLNGNEAPRRRVRINPVAVLALIAALGVAAWGIEVATQGANDQLGKPRFTSLWVVPPRSGQGSGVSFGVANREGEATSYRLKVRRGSEIVEQWRFQLDPDQQWQAPLTASIPAVEGRLVGSLYRNGRLDQSVTLEIGGRS
jgi:uncharacterized membrane protein